MSTLKVLAHMPAGERIVSVVKFRDRVFVASETKVYELEVDDTGETRLGEIKFVAVPV